MGDWAIVVEGTGAHHNKDFPQDADRMTQKFVDALISAGHEVRLATFTSGGRTVLDISENYEARQRRFADQNAHTSDQQDEWKVAAGKAAAEKRGALSTLGLYPTARKDAVPGAVVPVEGIQSVEIT